MKLIRNFADNIDDNSMILICVFRDENILLEYFMSYYKKIGITHFIMIDNGSKDGGFEYIKELDGNIMLFQTKEPFKNNKVSWINNILNNYCKNKWCLVVDIDELIYTDNINELKNNMINENYNVCSFLLLDMYANHNEKYIRGNNFLEHSCYFDKYSNNYSTQKFKNKLNYNIYGGVRKRIINRKPCLIKRSFFYYNFYDNYRYSIHRLYKNDNSDTNSIKIYPKIEYLLHFKFIKPKFKSFILSRITKNQMWNNCSEYKSYLKINTNKIYNEKISCKLKSKEELDKIFEPIQYV
jgi:hypothetical protein